MARLLRLSTLTSRIARPHHLVKGIAELLEAVRDIVDAAAGAIDDRRWHDVIVLLDIAARVLRDQHRCEEVLARRGLSQIARDDPHQS